LKSSPNDASAYFLLGESYRRRNDPKEREQAIQNYQMAMALNSTFADPHRGLGTLYYQEGKKREARESFERYLTLAPTAKDRPFIEGIVRELVEAEKRP
jgi:tetratricopeptide (TPR) repeat protein